MLKVLQTLDHDRDDFTLPYLKLPRQSAWKRSMPRLSIRHLLVVTFLAGTIYVSFFWTHPTRQKIVVPHLPKFLGKDSLCHRTAATQLWPGQLVQLQDSAASDNPYLPVRPPTSAPSLPIHLERFPVPLNCLDDHIAKGVECVYPEAQRVQKIDVVWAWVNATDKLHGHAYKANLAALKATNPTSPGIANIQPKAGSFREFDELRYSIRSIYTNFQEGSGDLIILTSDFPVPGCEERAPVRLGQLPRWLLNGTDAVDVDAWESGHTKLKVTHHSKVFPPLGPRSIFNSIAIESRLGYLEGVSDYFVYMNDDIFLNRKVTARDFYTEELGPVIRLQSDLVISGRTTRKGEWVPVQEANYLLNQRFGNRTRPYVTHFSKVMSTVFLREVSTVWSDALSRTATHSFRSLFLKFDPDISPTILATHWPVERWREMLLWSYFIGKLGGDGDEWTEDSFDQLYDDLNADKTQEKIDITRQSRSTLQDIYVALVKQAQGDTRTDYVYSSYDGYPYAGLGRSGWKSFIDLSGKGQSVTSWHPTLKCGITIARCFKLPPESSLTATEVFKHVAFRYPECGDCILNGLINKAGPKGLEPLLPDPKRQFPHNAQQWGESQPMPMLPLTPEWYATDFSLKSIPYDRTTVREWVVRALIRYRFVLGASPQKFVMNVDETSVVKNLQAIDVLARTAKDPVIICINDDVKTGEDVVRTKMKEWFQWKWPTPVGWERS